MRDGWIDLELPDPNDNLLRWLFHALVAGAIVKACWLESDMFHISWRQVDITNRNPEDRC